MTCMPDEIKIPRRVSNILNSDPFMCKNTLNLKVADELVKMVGYSYWLLISSAGANLKSPLADLVDQSALRTLFSGETFCRFSQGVATVGVVHSYVGGTGIALMRLLFIKYPTRMPFGETATALMLTVVTLAVTSVASYVWIVSPRRSQDLASMCMGRPFELDLALFHIAIGPTSVKGVPKSPGIVAVICVGFGFVLAEIAIYLAIFRYLIAHNKMMKLVLAEDVVKRRVRKNVIDCGGHTINFFIEMMLLVCSLVGLSWMTSHQKLAATCFSYSVYGILGAFHIGYSAQLRQEFLKLLKTVKSTWKHIKSVLSERLSGRQVQPVVAAAQVMPVAIDQIVDQ